MQISRTPLRAREEWRELNSSKKLSGFHATTGAAGLGWPNACSRPSSRGQSLVSNRLANNKADDKKMGLTIFYNNTSGQPLSELLSFPQHPSMAIGYDAWAEREKQRRLAEESGATEKAPEEIEEGLGSNQSAELAVFKENR